MPSSGPRSQCALGAKSNCRGSPTRRTSTLSASLLPTGTDSCGRLGRRTECRGPSLVVAPKSLMFNWRAESQRFTPQLRVLEHTGLARDTALIAEHDLILTTYGTLLRDAAQLSQ